MNRVEKRKRKGREEEEKEEEKRGRIWQSRPERCSGDTDFYSIHLVTTLHYTPHLHSLHTSTGLSSEGRGPD